MVSQVFAFVETRKTADLYNKGLSKDEAWEKIEEENLYQLNNPTRLRRTFNYISNRLESLPDEAIQQLPALDTESAKILVLISIMKTDLLFFEFVYEVYRGKVILGEKNIENRDINGFFDAKASQSEVVNSWSETGIKKLKNCYIRNLVDAGLLEDNKSKRIKPALINYRMEDFLVKNGMEAFVKAVKGER